MAQPSNQRVRDHAVPNAAPAGELSASPPKHRTEPAKGLFRAAIDLLSGADDPGLQAKPDKPEFPGVFSFMRQNWTSPEGEANEGVFRKYRRLNREYDAAKVREAGKLRTYETIGQSAALSKEFLALLFASCIIATTGLFQGSTAVIIGAMLIAPLMAPILGFALATVWGDRRLLWRSVGALLIGSALVLSVASSVTMLVPGVELNDEIRGRINPNLYDILVAVASGLIGTYAYANPRISPSIAGVSIAVALMPPLCTVGIGVGIGNSDVAIGALLLYLSNLLGISLAACFVFWRLRIHPITESDTVVGSRARRNVVLTSVLLALIAVPLGYFMREAYIVKTLDARVRHVLQGEIESSELLSLDIQKHSRGYRIKSVVIVPAETDDAEIVAARSKIEEMVSETAVVRLLVLRSGSERIEGTAVAAD